MGEPELLRELGETLRSLTAPEPAPQHGPRGSQEHQNADRQPIVEQAARNLTHGTRASRTSVNRAAQRFFARAAASRFSNFSGSMSKAAMPSFCSKSALYPSA